jgi:hypothetical protein
VDIYLWLPVFGSLIIMRLLTRKANNELILVTFDGKDIPPYAILSHTWGADSDEVTFNDIIEGTGKSKAGYEKIRFIVEQAALDGLSYSWVDTCCTTQTQPSATMPHENGGICR